MPEIRPEEAFASACIGSALGEVDVRHHDDQSQDRMFDLEVRCGDETIAAVEVTMAADEPSIELWRIIQRGGSWVVDGVVGSWHVALLPNTRARDVLPNLPALLRDLETAGVPSVRPGSFHHGGFEEAAARLRIADLLRLETSHPGKVYLNVEQPLDKRGGAVADTGDALAEWLGPWIRHPKRARKLDKLVCSGAGERHLFVVLPSDSDAPFAVTDLLFRPSAPLPTIPLDVPDEVTHVWVVSTWEVGDGMRWSREDGWERFAKPLGREPAR
jgi:hypothetical protein